MLLGADHVRVRVPATSANLGPGFDAMGLALGLVDEVEVRALGSADVVVEVTGEGEGSLPTGEDHLVVRSLREALDRAGAPQTGLHLSCTNRIPHGRGLGSSAAAVVAGIIAARLLLADPEALSDEVALQLAAEAEGHPDNAAPALLGGATVAWTEPHGARAARLDVHPDIDPIVLVPDHCVPTRTARKVLPAQVPHVDAAFTAGRAALLVHALTQRPDLLFAATADRLHQGYRAEVMPQSVALVNLLRAGGLPAVISGAGPTVLVLASTGAPAEARVAEVLAQHAARQPVPDGQQTQWQILRPGVAAEGAAGERLGR